MSRARLCRRTPLAPLPSRALPCCRALSSLADVAASAGSLPSSPRVLYSVDGPIATISLNNPAKRNALDLRGYEEIPAAVEAVTAEEGVRYEAPRPPFCHRLPPDHPILVSHPPSCPRRVVIIRGEGDIAFGAGSDISEFQERRSGDSTARYNDAEAAASAALQGIPHPTIAMIHVRAGLPPAFPLCPCCRACWALRQGPLWSALCPRRGPLCPPALLADNLVTAGLVACAGPVHRRRAEHRPLRRHPLRCRHRHLLRAPGQARHRLPALHDGHTREHAPAACSQPSSSPRCCCSEHDRLRTMFLLLVFVEQCFCSPWAAVPNQLSPTVAPGRVLIAMALCRRWMRWGRRGRRSSSTRRGWCGRRRPGRSGSSRPWCVGLQLSRDAVAFGALGGLGLLAGVVISACPRPPSDSHLPVHLLDLVADWCWLVRCPRQR